VPQSREYYAALSDEDLDSVWKQRVKLGITGGEELMLRSLLRERKGFKPVEVHVSMCMRCNLPADNCACLNR
jgi:hypothetical protein